MFIKLYETVSVTIGVKRALIADTHTKNNDFIPIEMAEYCLSIQLNSTSDHLKACNKRDKKCLNEYNQFILERGYGFVCSSLEELNYFPKKSLEFDTPYLISNCIIDISSESPFSLSSAFLQVNELEIPFLQIRVIENYSIEEIIELLNSLKIFNSDSVNEIFLLLPYTAIIREYIKETLFFEKYLIVLFYNSPHTLTAERAFNNVSLNYYNCNYCDIPKQCGIIKKDNFLLEENFYREALKFNTCLNKKISIDQYGEIKNCPSMLKSFGNINDTTLEQALNKKGFKDLWTIKKDEIKICKDCEFRHICTDCRAYLQDANDLYSKPLKCGYNPYTNEWEDWSTNPLSKLSIDYYGLQELVKSGNE